MLPSISRKAVPLPESFCMMKPSPPNSPVMPFFWKNTDSSTPFSEARKALFWTTIGESGRISTARIEPGNFAAKAIMPLPSAV